jgi:hypothetical protein
MANANVTPEPAPSPSTEDAVDRLARIEQTVAELRTANTELRETVATLTVALVKMANANAEGVARQRALWQYLGAPAALGALMDQALAEGPADALYPYVPGIAERDAEGNRYDETPA